MNKLIGAGVAVISIVGTVYMRRQFAKYDFFSDIELPEHAILTPPDLTPGAWYCYYLGDYLTEHPGASVVSSSPVLLSDGTFAWATATPEWDRDWFEKRGNSFPTQWMPYSDLRDLNVEWRPVA